MFERFTEEARNAIMLARECVLGFGHAALAPGHMLFGILRTEGGWAQSFLRGRGIAVDDLLGRVEALLAGSEPAAGPRTLVPFSSEVRQALKAAFDECAGLKSRLVSTGHLMLGLMQRDPDGVAPLLAAAGVVADELRSALRDDPLREASEAAAEGQRQGASSMLGRFSEEARRAITIGRDAVKRLGHASFEPGHLLYGLLQVEDGPAVQFLLGRGVSATRLLERVEALMNGFELVAERGTTVPFSRIMRMVLKAAFDECAALEQRLVSGGHLLLGLMQRDPDAVAPLLEAEGVTAAELRSYLSTSG
jgi:ATP-dependent Clp protease ATP-binding subunit ClpA